jgi:pyruvate dehydrogenase phosphatase regulatory subunit
MKMIVPLFNWSQTSKQKRETKNFKLKLKKFNFYLNYNLSFMIISPVSQQTRNMKWLSEHFPEDGSVLMSDITSLYAALSLVGPKATELLGELTDESLSTKDFPRFTCKEIDIGYASGIKAMRLTHTGEDGFILYVPTEYSMHVYDTLMEKGKNFGIKNAGYYAMRALRIEKMYAFWGQDLDKNVTPFGKKLLLK